MYPPKHFTDNHNTEAINDIITANPLATMIIKARDGAVDISHVPLHFAKSVQGYESLNTTQLIGHVSNHHLLAKYLVDFEPSSAGTVELQLVFHGENAYISPSLRLQEQVVPTWNYANIHIRGKAKPVSSTEEKLKLMAQSTSNFEAAFLEQFNSAEKPWSIKEVSEKRLLQMLNAITFFTIELCTLEARFKLSQNKSKQAQNNIATAMASQGKSALARLVHTC